MNRDIFPLLPTLLIHISPHHLIIDNWLLLTKNPTDTHKTDDALMDWLVDRWPPRSDTTH